MASVLGKISPEVFSFGFDPEVATSLWGLIRPAEDLVSPLSPPPVSQIPNAPFQILVPTSTGAEGATVLSILQAALATSGVLVVVTVGSFTAYKIIHAARNKYLKSPNEPHQTQQIVVRQQLSSASSSVEFMDAEAKTPTFVEASVQQPPVRPSTLCVARSQIEHRINGIRQSAGNLLSVAKFPSLSRSKKVVEKSPERELVDFDDIEHLSDIEPEYFGPDLTDDSVDEFDYKTPCA